MLSQIDLSAYLKLFTGHSDFFGCHIYKKTEEGQKEKGQSFTKDEPLVIDHYKQHLEGKEGLGLIPIDKNNNVRFMVFDVDTIGIDVKPFIDINNAYELPFNFFRSKSGGLHIYVFFNEDIKAKNGLDYMERFIHIFGLSKETEIFPKQTRLLKNQKGNWINLPYYNKENSGQYLYNEKGEKLTFSSAMLYLLKRQINFLQFKETYENLPLYDAPICLQAINIHKQLTNRNMFLFDCVTYFKVKGEDYEDKITHMNSRLSNPVSEKELQQTVIKSQKKKSYSYRCKEEPMYNNCNKDLCLKRLYGYGGDQVSKLSFENLIQVRADQPYYKWTVNGVVMTFYSESELRDQSKFADYCMRELHIIPNILRRDKWFKILELAFKEVVVEAVDPEDDISPGALFRSYLQEFLLDRAYARSKSQVRMNRVFKNDELNEFSFKKESLIKFLFVQKNFKMFTVVEIQDRLKRIGAVTKKFYCGNKITIRVWSIPFAFVKDKMVSADDQILNFSDLKEKEEF